MKQTIAKDTSPMDIHFSRSLFDETESKITDSFNNEDERTTTTKSDNEGATSRMPVETVLKACSAPTCSESLLSDISAAGYLFKKGRHNLRANERIQQQKESWQETLEAETPPYLSPQRKELKQAFEFN